MFSYLKYTTFTFDFSLLRFSPSSKERWVTRLKYFFTNQQESSTVYTPKQWFFACY